MKNSEWKGGESDTLLQPFKDQLALQSKYGYVTQQQADARLQYEQGRVKDLINTAPGPNGNNGYGYGSCHGGGWGGFGGMMGSFGGRGMMGWW
ncbi:MAG: hypothetical protein Q8O86_04465 [Dehalococcoidia bacterium]|nr:hypothetical protein [Dehalococcoidia bacterium]